MSPRLPPRYDLPKAATGPLRPVQVFVNTTDGHERELLGEWLADEGVRATPAALTRARRVREALRELLVANNEGRESPAAAVRVLDEAAARSRFSLRFSGEAARLVPTAKGVDRALGSVLAGVYAGMEEGTWPRLKACRNCRWAFYDYSRNRSACWCSMQLCGNRRKTREYRRRRRRSRTG